MSFCCWLLGYISKASYDIVKVSVYTCDESQSAGLLRFVNFDFLKEVVHNCFLLGSNASHEIEFNFDSINNHVGVIVVDLGCRHHNIWIVFPKSVAVDHVVF